MSEIIFGIVFFVIIFAAAALFGFAIGAWFSERKEKKTDDYFLRRDNYRAQIKGLKKELEKSKEICDGLHKDNVALRLALGDMSDEAAELRVALRKLEKAKERGNDGK